MIEVIVSGVGLGIILSFLTGPAFFALLKTSIEKGFYGGISFAFGVFVADILYVALSLYGSSYIAREREILFPLGIIGSVVLLGVGIHYILKKVTIKRSKCLSKREHSGYFIKGFAMCIFNPTLLLYWISVTSGVVSISNDFDLKRIIPFFACVLLTQLGIDSVKAFYADKLSHKIEECTLNKINKFAGALIIVFALRLMYELVFTHTII
ncbi:LysE family translocator [Olivibacter domesticus]|uniref:Threonine/homoserine/homoserine lactone efflux protein n=1 Tax=Olivibacter domesticus TaxID=407022 RepID=A0A1H7U8A9_OLID1|nr:LysE family translocator [Olivibacter domesticus]SEL93211.1 Threonine/homoserine/homoserine lactone efflux protein [Olivibacter domesticus]